MQIEIKVGEITARVERPILSDVVALTIGHWPVYTTLSLNQSTARELGMALMTVGFDYAEEVQS